MGSTNRVRGTPNESLWTRIAFDGTRPPDGMLASFSHIPKQRGRHPRSSRLTEIGPHLLKCMVGDGSAEHAQKRFAIAGFGDVLLGGVSTEFSEAALKVDGGMAQNALFLQRLADILNLPILRPKMAESTAFGAACLAGLGGGLYGSLNEVAGLWKPDAKTEPQLDSAARERDLAGWRDAVKRTLTPRTRS